MYGVNETNPLPQGFHDEGWSRTVDWTEKGLRVTRLRLISDIGFPFWDVSYCFGVIGTEKVRVALPFSQLPRRGTVRAIVQHAQRDGVFARGLGILDNISTLV
jgi:hypothetical protein